MELEKRIIDQINRDNDFKSQLELNQKILQEVNKKITYLSVDIVEDVKNANEATKNLENFLFENII